MKKFYAIALLAMAAATANAQDAAPLYATGDFFGSEDANWKPDAPAQFTYDVATSTYVLEPEFEVSMLKISTAMGDWDTFNASCLTTERAYTKEDLGTPVPLVAGDANINMPYMGKYKIEVAGDLKTITLTAQSEEKVEKLCLRGDMNGWGNDGVAEEWYFKQDAEDANVWYLNLTTPIEAAQSFKIAGDLSWSKYNYGVEEGSDPLVLDVPYTLNFEGSNITLDEECAGAVVFNMESLEVVFQAEPYVAGVAGVSVENGKAVYFNMQGVRVNEPANGLYIVVKDGKAVKVAK